MDEKEAVIINEDKLGPAPVAPPGTEVKEKKEKAQLVTKDSGQFALTTLNDQLSFAQRVIDEGMISETFKTAAQVVLGFQYAKALGMNEMLALKMMYVVNGKPCLYSEGPLALAQRSKSFWKINEYYVDEAGKKIEGPKKDLAIFGSVTELWRVGDDAPQVDWFTLDDMKTAGLDQNKWGKKEVWAKWERIMLRYKARTLALRSKFADSLAGIPIAEYDFHFTPNLPEVNISGKTTVTKSYIADRFQKPLVQGVARQSPESCEAVGGLVL